MYFFHLQTGLNSNYTRPLRVYDIFIPTSLQAVNDFITQAKPGQHRLGLYRFPFLLTFLPRRAFNLENWTSYIGLLSVLLQFLTIPEFRLWAIYVLYW